MYSLNFNVCYNVVINPMVRVFVFAERSRIVGFDDSDDGMFSDDDMDELSIGESGTNIKVSTFPLFITSYTLNTDHINFYHHTDVDVDEEDYASKRTGIIDTVNIIFI